MRRNLYARLHFAVENYFEYETKMKRLHHKKDVHFIFNGDRILRNKYYSMSHTFAGYLKREKNIKTLDKLSGEVVTDFLNFYSDSDWRRKTKRRYLDYFITLPVILEFTYGQKFDLISPRLRDYLIMKSKITFYKNHYLEAVSYFLNLNTNTRFVPLLLYLTGTSYPGISRLSPEDIDLKKKVVIIKEMVNFKRYYTIAEYELPLWEEIKSFCQKNKWLTVVNGTSNENLNSGVEYYLRKLTKNPLNNYTAKNWSAKIYVQRAFEEGLKKNTAISKIIEGLVKEFGKYYKRYCKLQVSLIYENAISFNLKKDP